MPSIPLDVLLEILKHVGKVDLVTLCRVNKIFCSCSRDVLYREIDGDEHVIRTLAQSTDLARRVRSFNTSCRCPELAMALRNMSSLRSFDLYGGDGSILDGCTFKLESFTYNLPYSEPLRQFLISQPSLTKVTLNVDDEPFPPFDERCLPNLTRVEAPLSWLRILIPGRPVREVTMRLASNTDSIDFFTLSTTPIQNLKIHYEILYSKPVSLLVSAFPSLVHFVAWIHDMEWIERVRLCLSI
jgi:F-box domain